MTSAFGDQKVPMMTSASNVGPGWHPIIDELEIHLNALDPNFELQQVKEKFGGLRYYANSKVVPWEEFNRPISEAEAKSFRVCEECGEPAETKSYWGWLKTLCEEHKAEREANHARTVQEMQQEHGGES